MADTSEDAVAQALGAVLRDHGWEVADSTRRLRGSLNDVLGARADDHRAGVDALVIAVEEAVVRDLLSVGRAGAGVSAPALTARLTEWGLDVAVAAWAVRTWADRLPVATIPPPATMPPGQEPTTLPPAGTAPDPGVTLAPPRLPGSSEGSGVLPPDAASDRTMAPGSAAGPTSPPARPDARRRPRGRVLAVVGAVAVIAAGGIAAAVALDDAGPAEGSAGRGASSTSADEPPSSPASPPSPAAPAEPGAVIAAAGARVPATEGDLAMAGRQGGVRVSRLGEVDSVGTGAAALSAPEGGMLIGFRLSDWACGGEECRPWGELGLEVDVDGTRSALPGRRSNDTFVVAVPAEASTVELVLRSDGLTQTLSLLERTPGRDNIAVLARRGRVDEVGDRFTMTESTSIAFDYDGVARSSVPRDVTVNRAELVWFTSGTHPSSTRRAFLKVRMHYTIPIGSYSGREAAFEAEEMRFVARDGKRYAARDLDDGPGVNAVFEVPADLEGGRLVLGGDTYPAQAAGTPFTRTLSERSVQLRFG